MATWPKFFCISEKYGTHGSEAWLSVVRAEDGCCMARFWPYGLEDAKQRAEALCDELNAQGGPF